MIELPAQIDDAHFLIPPFALWTIVRVSNKQEAPWRSNAVKPPQARAERVRG
jgi:hypothetical protein